MSDHGGVRLEGQSEAAAQAGKAVTFKPGSSLDGDGGGNKLFGKSLLDNKVSALI